METQALFLVCRNSHTALSRDESGQFKGAKLLEGWLVVKDANKDESGNSLFTWKLREDDDVKQERKRLAEDLCEALDKRVDSFCHKGVLI